MSWISSLSEWFKAGGSEVAAQQKETPELQGSTAYGESMLYGSADWPKYNPDSLMSVKGRSIYRKMMLDEQVKAVIKFRKDAILGPGYFFEHDDAERVDIANQIVQRMQGSFVDALQKVLTAFSYGFSLVEKNFMPIDIDGKTWIGIDTLDLKPFESFEFYVDPFGKLERIRQRIGTYEADLDHAKFIHFVNQPEEDAHYGQSYLREAYRAWFSKDATIKFWNIWLERHATGIAVLTQTGNTVIADGSPMMLRIQNMMNNLQAKSWLLLPKDLALDIKQPANQVAFEDAKSSNNRDIAKAALVPNLLGITEQGNTGSYSQSSVQFDAFLWTLATDSMRLEECINEQLFQPLGVVNFADGRFPRFRLKQANQAQIMEILKRWIELVNGKSVRVSDADEAHARKMLGFPEADEASIERRMTQAVKAAQTAVGGSTEKVDQNQAKPETGKENKEADNDEAEKKKKAFTRAIKRVDFAVIDRSSTAIASGGTDKTGDALTDGVEEIKNFIKRENVLENPDKIAEIKIPTKMLRKIRERALVAFGQAWDLGLTHAKQEITRAKGATFAAALPLNQDAADKFLQARAQTFAMDQSEAVRKKVQTIMYNSIKGSWTLDETTDAIDDEINATSLPQLATAVRTSTFEAINEARFGFFSDPALAGYVEALEYSSIIDSRTTDICRTLDGHIHALDSEVWQTYKPPNHFNCRALLIPVTVDDNWTEDDAPRIDPQEGFG